MIQVFANVHCICHLGNKFGVHKRGYLYSFDTAEIIAWSSLIFFSVGINVFFTLQTIAQTLFFNNNVFGKSAHLSFHPL